MKTTKILKGVAIAAMTLSLTGCVLPGKGLGNVPITTDEKTNNTTKAEVTGTVDFTNSDTSKYARGMQTFQNKKNGITAKVVMENVTASSNPGCMGLVFDMKKNIKDDLWNFCNVGFKNNSGKPCVYVSYFEGVSEADFSKSNFGVPDSSRIDILDWTNIDGIDINNNELAIVIEVEAIKAENSQDADNAYIIRIYKDEDGDGTVTTFKGLSNKSDDEKNKIHNNAKKTINITREQVRASKQDRQLQEKMGFYANVYGGQTLTGKWLVADIDHQPNVAKTASNNDSFIKIEY